MSAAFAPGSNATSPRNGAAAPLEAEMAPRGLPAAPELDPELPGPEEANIAQEVPQSGDSDAGDAGSDDGSASSSGKLAKKVPSAAASAPDLPCCCGLRYATAQYHLMPYAPSVYKQDAFQLAMEVMSGCTVALAQVSEAIAFALLAGVDPQLGLHASWIIGGVIALFGSRPGMMNGSTGVRAAVIAPFVEEYGTAFLFYIVCWIAFWQVVAAVFNLSRFIRFVPRTVMVGFLNGLGCILIMGQIPQFRPNAGRDPLVPASAGNSTTAGLEAEPGTSNADLWLPTDVVLAMVVLVACTVVTANLVPLIPRIGKSLPPSLMGLVVATVVEHAIIRPIGYETPLIEDIGSVSGGLPKFFWADPQYDGLIPAFNWANMQRCIFPGFIAAAAGMVEAVLTMEVVNDITDTDNPRPDQQLLALGAANMLSGLLGTMGGGANLPMTIVATTNGANGRYRISGIMAAIVLLIIILAASPLINLVPTAALVGVMVMVIVNTIEWRSLAWLAAAATPRSWREHSCLRATRKIRRSDVAVLIIVPVVTVFVDLFSAVLVGVLFSAAVFAWEKGHEITVRSRLVDDGKRKIYHVDGSLFFVSSWTFLKFFTFNEDPDEVEVHFANSDVHDFTGIYTLNYIGEKYAQLGKTLRVKCLPEGSLRRLQKAHKLVTHFSYDEKSMEDMVLEAPHRFNMATDLAHYVHLDEHGHYHHHYHHHEDERAAAASQAMLLGPESGDAPATTVSYETAHNGEGVRLRAAAAAAASASKGGKPAATPVAVAGVDPSGTPTRFSPVSTEGGDGAEGREASVEEEGASGQAAAEATGLGATGVNLEVGADGDNASA